MRPKQKRASWPGGSSTGPVSGVLGNPLRNPGLGSHRLSISKVDLPGRRPLGLKGADGAPKPPPGVSKTCQSATGPSQRRCSGAFEDEIPHLRDPKDLNPTAERSIAGPSVSKHAPKGHPPGEGRRQGLVPLGPPWCFGPPLLVAGF
ncbi:unnamed protein product [Arctia plantaginis]|uniref:Uncharacterized protein n=1 Tax=Arctia plantaginis TaxID=874455 RepID=A0A8S1BJT8_ARCPL|nr:unnamed protein product [Arctia plantaginis]